MTNLFILTQARSGSNLLISYLNSFSDLNLHEINKSEFVDWSSYCESRSTQNYKVFPASLSYIPVVTFLNAKNHIYYIRLDVINQSVSEFIAHHIQKHVGLIDDADADILDELMQDELKCAKAIHGFFKRCYQNHYFWHYICSRYNLDPYILYYEDLVRTPQETLEKVFGYLGIDTEVVLSKAKIPVIQTTEYNAKFKQIYMESDLYGSNPYQSNIFKHCL